MVNEEKRMPTARLKLGVKKERDGCPQPMVRRMARRRERRDGKQALRQVAAYDPAHWPEAGISNQ